MVATQLVGFFRDQRKRAETLNRMSLKDTKGLPSYMKLEKQVEPKEDSTSLLRPNGIQENK